MGGRHARLGADKAKKLVFVRANLKLLANDYTKRPFIAWDPDSVESDGFLGEAGRARTTLTRKSLTSNRV